jgi:hypothetical protein
MPPRFFSPTAPKRNQVVTFMSRLRRTIMKFLAAAWIACAAIRPLPGIAKEFAPPQPPTVIAIASSGMAQTLSTKYPGDVVYNVTMTGNCLFTLSGGVSGSRYIITIFLRQDPTAGRSPSFSSNVSWPGNVAPTFNTAAGGYDIVQFVTVDGGNTFAGQLVASNVAAAAVPGMPTSAVATAGNTQNIINANPLYATPGVTGYNIYRGTSSGGESSTPIASNVSLPYNDTGLTNGTAYYYEVAGVNSSGVGAKSSEVSATPSTTAYGHYAAFNGSSGYIYTPYNTAFDPGSNPFSYRAFVSPTTATPSAYVIFIGIWENSPTTNNEHSFGIAATSGDLVAQWINGSGQICSATSTVAPGFQSGIPMWVRADVVPTTGQVTFYTSPDGTVWTQLGSIVYSTNTGAVQTPSSPLSFIIGQTYSGGGVYGQLSGNFYAAQFWINGTLIADPVAGASSTTDAEGWGWITSASNVTYH